MKQLTIFAIWFIWVLLCPVVIYLIASYVSWEWWSFADATGDERGGFLFGTVVAYTLTFMGPAMLKEHIYGW